MLALCAAVRLCQDAADITPTARTADDAVTAPCRTRARLAGASAARRRQRLTEENRDHVIVFIGPRYGIFHLAEFAVLAGLRSTAVWGSAWCASTRARRPWRRTRRPRRSQGRATRTEHYAPAGQAFVQGAPHACVEQARQVGVATGALVQALLEPYLLVRLREAQALLRLRDRYPDERLERACRRALDEGDGRVRTVRGILERGLAAVAQDDPPEPRATVAFLRGAAAFAPALECESLRWRGGHARRPAAAPAPPQALGHARRHRRAGGGGAPAPWTRWRSRPCCSTTNWPAATPTGWRGASARPTSTEVCDLRDFDVGYNPEIPKARLWELAAGRFVEDHAAVLLCGPTGVGKSFVAQACGVEACGVEACRRQHSVLFAKTAVVLTDLVGGRADGSYPARLRRYLGPSVSVLILDDCALREYTVAQSEDLYEVVSRRYRRGALILTTNRAPRDLYPLFPNPVLAEGLLDRLLNSAYVITMLGRSYRPRQRPDGAWEASE